MKDGVPTHPPETMEMHVYKLMEKQYGLRTLAIDNTATLVNSLDILSDEDNDIAVFKCVFGNIIGEDFVAVQTELVSYDFIIYQNNLNTMNTCNNLCLNRLESKH